MTIIAAIVVSKEIKDGINFWVIAFALTDNERSFSVRLKKHTYMAPDWMSRPVASRANEHTGVPSL